MLDVLHIARSYHTRKNYLSYVAFFVFCFCFLFSSRSVGHAGS